MRYRTLGKTGIEVSIVALGCRQFAGGAMWGDQAEEDSFQAVDTALEAGINLFDTAEGYGKGSSEEVLGRELKGKRAQAVIATKAGGPTFTPEELTAACENSLRRLQTDYIDIYQLHWPRPGAVQADVLFEGVEGLLQSGKIRYFGVCNFGTGDLANLQSAGSVACNQLCYSLLWRGIEYNVVPACEQNDIGILTYSSLVHGLLSGKYESLDDFPAARARTLHFSNRREGVRHEQEGQEDLTTRTIGKIKRLCGEAGLSMTQAAYGWVLHQKQVTSLLAGARNAEHVRQNAAIATLDFPRDFIASLTSASDDLKAAFGAHEDMWQVPGRIS